MMNILRIVIYIGFIVLSLSFSVLCFQGKWHILGRYKGFEKVDKSEKTLYFWITRVLEGLLYLILSVDLTFILITSNLPSILFNAGITLGLLVVSSYLLEIIVLVVKK